MKKLLFFFISATIVLASCQSDGSEKSVEEVQAMVPSDEKIPAAKNVANKQPVEPEDTVNVAKLQFPEAVFEFGTVNEGEKVNHVFEFTNTGKEPLVISNARGSCGCTVPEWPKEPIAVGEKGEIKVVFNTAGKKNQQTKTVTLTANTYPVSTVLSLKGTVTPKPAGEAKKGEKKKKGEAKAAAHDHDHGSHDGHDH